MSFSIHYDASARKFLKKLDAQFSKRIMNKIDQLLPDNPVPHDVKSIVGEHGVFRVRVGDFRILYRTDYQENKIIIITIDKRERVYD